MTSISKDLLDILVCPACKKPILQEGDTLRCTNEPCSLIYPIRNGIPVMLIEEAVKAPDSKAG